MSCQDLVCAQCAHPVIEGRCPLCRANRERLHQHGFGGLSPAVIVVALLVLLFLSLALKHLAGV
ncbi:hypothetical protein OIE66_34035 [Nonomuraea sp. NBC_01738]|uniref:hypothetical protein n=1 Tax=Nonomuraea sp. NBC_01738 TaxID=2976003 RepID=UPI002E1126A9|nr:hypothetical protein OIE66_34035 [Nonomuraea sp. NBC_01738]